MAVGRKSRDGAAIATFGKPSPDSVPRSWQSGSHRADTVHATVIPTNGPGKILPKARGQRRIVARQVPATIMSALPNTMSCQVCDQMRRHPMPDMKPVSTTCGK